MDVSHDNTESAFCPNKDCKNYGLRDLGDIAIRGKFSKEKTKDLL